MKRSSLTLMTEVLMVLLFIIAAAICMDVFANTYSASIKDYDINQAAALVQSEAELIKSAHADVAIAPTTHYYNDSLELIGASYVGGEPFTYAGHSLSETAYVIEYVSVPNDYPGTLGTAEVVAKNPNGEELFSLEVSYQEVSADE